MLDHSAYRCLSELLKQPRGRNLLQEHQQFSPLLTGLQNRAQHFCHQLVTSFKAAQPAVPDEQAGKSKAKKGKGNKATHGSVIPAADTSPAQADAAPQLMQVMCRAALHMALMKILLQDGEQEQEEEEATARAECLGLAASVLTDAQDLAEQVRL
jgi:hypothetical protein